MKEKKRIQGLYAIADSTWSLLPSLADLAENFLLGGCGVIQLRMKNSGKGRLIRGSRKNLDSRVPTSPRLRWASKHENDKDKHEDDGFLDNLLNEAKNIMMLKRSFDFIFIVNDFPDVAAEVDADGVHVGENDMSIDEIKKLYGDDLIIGYSSHSLAEAIEAEKKGADYVAFGAIFPTLTKGPGHPIQGLVRLAEVVRALSVPVVAIGGINRNNFKSVLETGAKSFAMINALARAENIPSEVKLYVEGIGNCRI